MVREFFDEATDLFTLFDKELNLIAINKTALHALHVKREDVIGKNIVELMPGVEASGRLEQYKEVMRTGKTMLIDDFIPHPILGNYHMRVKAFKVGEGIGAVTTNVTDLVEAINELETFIYKASHDMRSPIASTLGLIDVADRQMKDLSDARSYLKIIKQQTETLDTVIRILIEKTRIREGEMTIDLIEFAEIIDGVLVALAFTEGFNKIDFVKQISLTQDFYSDRLLIISLIKSLVENSVKYQNHKIPNPFVHITVAEENKGIMIKVADNGIGIPENVQREVFRMFFRATDKSNGAGLGLYTVRHIVKKLGGHIALDSKENMGTTVSIYLPGENSEKHLPE